MLAKRKWLVAAIAATVLSVGAGAMAITRTSSPGMRLDADLSNRTLKVLVGGKNVRTYGIAVGMPAHPTPTGSFRTGGIEWNPDWTPPNSFWARNKTYKAPGEPGNPLRGVKIYFRAPAYYIHGTSNPASIGEAASHGCIRMTEGAAKELARRIEDAGGSVPLVIHW